MIVFEELNILKLKNILLILICSLLPMDKIKAPVLLMNNSHVDNRKSSNPLYKEQI